eukprot:5799736-Pleurochrysis_carterae.AAC.1
MTFLTLARRNILALVVVRPISSLACIVSLLYLNRMRTCGALALRSPISGTLARLWPSPPAERP